MIRNYEAKIITDLQARDRTYVNVVRMMDRGPEDRSPGWETIRASHIMPPDTLAIRAGEYGLDPGDTALLLDVVLYEGFIDYPEDAHPLWVSESIAAARERHLDEVATVKAAHAALGADWDRPKNYPSATLHRATLVRAAELAPVYRSTVDQARRMARDTWRARLTTNRTGRA